MTEVTKIWERLYLGSLHDAQRLAKANPHGITTVVSLSEHPPINTLPEITYVHNPVEDEQPIPLAQFTTILEAISNNIRRGKVLLHCGSGISRAPAMAAAYLHIVGYKHFDAALEEMAGLRRFISPTAILLASVREHLR
jgi:protein-tyrosine phosphatase